MNCPFYQYCGFSSDGRTKKGKDDMNLHIMDCDFNPSSARVIKRIKEIESRGKIKSGGSR